MAFHSPSNSTRLSIAWYHIDHSGDSVGEMFSARTWRAQKRVESELDLLWLSTVRNTLSSLQL